MDKFTQEIQEITQAVKKQFKEFYENESLGRGYYNWTYHDEKIIEITIREMWSRKNGTLTK